MFIHPFYGDNDAPPPPPSSDRHPSHDQWRTVEPSKSSAHHPKPPITVKTPSRHLAVAALLPSPFLRECNHGSSNVATATSSCLAAVSWPLIQHHSRTHSTHAGLGAHATHT
ncbi:hypothetical protein L2E82_45446 [Cichorium intybus]|uniref:Uncharacterized protein n=1 Tax=Cichorium intybus TaxID=13427 RepID=A0ACB8ZTC4_CICIN|nr:hypothetical protein L2E82_45446 [Cichorium intybus]